MRMKICGVDILYDAEAFYIAFNLQSHKLHDKVACVWNAQAVSEYIDNIGFKENKHEC